MPSLSPSGQSNVGAISPRFAPNVAGLGALNALVGDITAARREEEERRRREEAAKAAAAARVPIAEQLARMIVGATDPVTGGTVPAGGAEAALLPGAAAPGLSPAAQQLAEVLAFDDKGIAAGRELALSRGFPAPDVRQQGRRFVDVSRGLDDPATYALERDPEIITIRGRAYRVGDDGGLTEVANVPDEQLVEVYDADSPTGTRMVRRGEAAGRPGKPPSGLEVQFDPESGRPLSIAQRRQMPGAGGGRPLTPTVKSRVQTDILKAEAALQRLAAVEAAFDPAYLTFQGDLESAWLRFKDKAGMGLSGEQQAWLEGYTDNRQAAFRNLNRTLNELSGAAVNEHEAKRLLNELPDPDGDGPVAFKRKLDNSVAAQRAAIARLHYADANGLDPLASGFELDDMETVIDAQGKVTEQEVRAEMPDASEREIRIETGLRLARMFGLPFDAAAFAGAPR